jgi:hypothetical protein
MSSLESKIEYNSSNGEVEYNSSNGEVEVEEKEVEEEVEEDSGLNPNYGDCKWCNKAITKYTYKPVSIKPKGRKSYTVKVFCKDCQDHLYPCRNNCGKYLTLAGYIKGHHPNLCNRIYRESHPHTDIHEKISELKDEIEKLKDNLQEMTTRCNYWRKKSDSLEKLNKELKEKYEIFSDIIQKSKTYIQSDLHPRLARMSLSTCTNCRECRQHTVDKHNCKKCRPCDNCKNTIKIQDDKIYMNDEKFNNILHS